MKSHFASFSAYGRTIPLNKGAPVQLKDWHLKEKLVTTEKSLAVLAIAALAMMLPPPYSTESGLEPGITELDCLNSFEEPFDSH
ncbi:hypothetical protein HJC23_014070 [Cyclotella cryptica]|uniref:Uncharacterized protein n=1 Tax=Cyclotella cryptica TaxID=29204 RepID=A0ABD3QTC2_9STRA